MEFEDQEEEQEEEEEEKIELPPPSGYDSSSRILRMPGSAGESAAGGRKAAGFRYRECMKNHAVGIGGHAVDGCCEFMPAGAEGSLDALKCAACNCHRNFHRKEAAEGEGTTSAAVTPTTLYHHHHHLQQHPSAAAMLSPYYPTPSSAAAAGYFHVAAAQQRPLALPSTSGGGGAQSQDDVSNPSSGGGGVVGMGMMGSRSKKRFRTSFTAEQKERMLGLAERLGWRIQKHDEAVVQQFCDEFGVKRHVLKVWMHNNKHTLGKKNPT